MEETVTGSAVIDRVRGKRYTLGSRVVCASLHKWCLCPLSFGDTRRCLHIHIHLEDGEDG